MDNVKFAYLPDPKNKHRVITIARTVVEDTIYFQTAVNRCYLERSYYHDDGRFYHPKPVDKFDKDMAKRIASGRLESKPISLQRVEGEAPHITVLKYLSLSGMSFERRACKKYLSKPAPVQEERVYLAPSAF